MVAPSAGLAVILAAAAALGAGGGGEGKSATRFEKELEIMAKGGRAVAIGELLREMAASGDPKAIALIPAAGVALFSHKNYEAAVEAIAGLEDEAAVQALAGVLRRAKDYRQRTLVLEAFGKRSDAATLEAIAAEVKSGIVHVQVAAIRAARARKERGPIGPLVEVLEGRWKARDRTWYEAREALIALTGQDFESLEDWKKYAGGLPADFDPKGLGKEKGPTRIELKRTSESVEFFGSEIFSHNLVFVIDVSGSMIMYDESDDYKGSNVEADRQRLRRAREQLTLALKKLPKTALFNIITFSDKVVAWQKRLVPAAAANIASALKFVNDFQARGATHTDEALEKAFEDLAADTIVLLSDGAPMKKDPKDAQTLIPKIIARVKDLNAARKVTVHTFGFEGRGTWPKKVPFAGGGRLPPPPTDDELKSFVELLKTLASDNGGTFQAIQ